MPSFELIIDAGETLRLLGGWTELELEPDAVYLLPVRAVKLAPGMHVLRPHGTRDQVFNVHVRLLRLPPSRRIP